MKSAPWRRRAKRLRLRVTMEQSERAASARQAAAAQAQECCSRLRPWRMGVRDG